LVLEEKRKGNGVRGGQTQNWAQSPVHGQSGTKSFRARSSGDGGKNHKDFPLSREASPLEGKGREGERSAGTEDRSGRCSRRRSGGKV